MIRGEYYARMKALARSVRAAHGIAGSKVTRSDMRGIYRVYKIKIDIWPHKLKELRGAYFRDSLGAAVMVADLPTDPMVFTLAHELKHHLADQDRPLAPCGVRNQSEEIEIGAEIFAAELLFPEDEFRRALEGLRVGRGGCRPEHLVQLKRRTGTTLSYQGLVKRAEFLGFAPAGSLPRLGWKRLEEKLYGVPFYRRPGARARRNREAEEPQPELSL